MEIRNAVCVIRNQLAILFFRIISTWNYLVFRVVLLLLWNNPNRLPVGLIFLLLFLVRINLPLFSTVVPSNICMFLSCRPFVVITLLTGLVGVEVTSVSWLGQLTEFKSLIILIVGFRNFFCCLVWDCCCVAGWFEFLSQCDTEIYL